MIPQSELSGIMVAGGFAGLAYSDVVALAIVDLAVFGGAGSATENSGSGAAFTDFTVAVSVATASITKSAGSVGRPLAL